ncbi:MAG TPA: MFS transporter [Oligoflexia bacterium]|nr:MFS transporter [Oligoflexia bacterium]HMP48453.1 MFS transporter [Oligoflexia bacterium]
MNCDQTTPSDSSKEFTDCKSRTFLSLIFTQFLGAFNDNIFKTIVSLLVLESMAAQDGKIIYLSLTAALFFLPYILFSDIAGFLADRYSKTVIVQRMKLLEIIIMFGAFISFHFNSVFGLLTSVFLMGTQSALFSPSKYGILPEMVSIKDISKANGYLEFSTFLAIITGTAIAGIITAYTTINPGVICIIIAVFGYICSKYVDYIKPSGSNRSISLDPIRPHLKTLRSIRSSHGLFLSVLGISFFWTLGALIQLNILLYAKSHLLLSDIYISLLLSVIGIGIGAGSIFAGKVSEGSVELGLVPLGSFILVVTTLSLFFFSSPVTLVFISSGLLGLGSGFFIVPVQSYLQEFSPPTKRGSFIAAANFLSFTGMLISSALFWFVTDYLNLSPRHLFLIMSISTVIITWYIITLMPEMLARCLNWIVLRSIYKINLSGSTNLPETGGALIVCNHVTYVDAMLVLAALRRPVRFIMFRPIYESKLIHPIAKIMKAIPISPADGKEKVIETLEYARELINEGEIVGIFAEGGLTRTGEVGEFKTGLETIMKESSSPVIPIHLGGLWGSIFSHEGGKVFWKRPKKIPYPVSITIGEKLPPETSAKTLEEIIKKMSC